MSSLPKRSDRQARHNGPRNPAVSVPEGGVPTDSFLLDSRNRGCVPEVKDLIIDLRLNARGVRETARSLPMSTNTVLSARKKKAPVRESVHTALLRMLNPDEITVGMERAGEAEMDEMWSSVGHQGDPRWIWHAMDHGTGAV